MAFVRRPQGFSKDAARELNAWFETLAGQRLAEHEQQLLSAEFRRLFAPLLVQIGGPVDAIRHSSAAHKLWITPEPMPDSEVGQVNGWAAQLPLAGNIADAVLLMHTLDVTRHPQAVLREAIRILRPGGSLLILGFDPTGWIGIKRSLRLRGQRAPWLRKQRLVDWLALLDCRVEQLQCAGYPKRLAALSAYNAPGAAIYLMRVKKERLIPPNALRQRLRGRLMPLAGSRSQAQVGRSVARDSVVVPFKRRR